MNYHQHISKKILDTASLTKLLHQLRFKEQKIVFTNGCFDILHLGHIDYLSRAASLGDFLIVGLNSDASVRKLKGTHRPIQDEHSRAMILASLFFVGAVVLFTEDTPYNLIQLVQPDILVKGADYTPDAVVGADIVKNKGGQVVLIDYLEGYSTSLIEQKIRNI